MKQLSSLDLYYLLKEFDIFINQRIDNFYLDDNIFYLRVYVKGKGGLYITNKLSMCLYFSKEKDNDSNHPNNFIQYLRKYLKSGIISGIEQVEGERIVKIAIDKKDEKDNIQRYYLVLELFANGNIILTDNDNKIKNALEKRKYKDRNILVRQEYEFPPKKDLSLFNLDKTLFKKKLEEEKDLQIVKFIALKFGIGGKFAEEVCNLSGIDKKVLCTELKENQIDTIQKILCELPKKEIKPILIKKDSLVSDFLPFNFSTINCEENNLECVNYESYNSVILEYFSQFKEDRDKRKDEFEKELKKLQIRLEKQISQKETVLKDYDKYNNIGNKIYENYALVEDLLKSINSAGKEKGWDNVRETIKNNEKLSKIIKKFDPKNNEIILDL